MKFRLFKLFSFAIITTFLFNTFINAQITTTTASGRNDGRTAQVEQAEAQVRRVTDDSGRFFKQALFHLQDNRHDVIGSAGGNADDIRFGRCAVRAKFGI